MRCISGSIGFDARTSSDYIGPVVRYGAARGGNESVGQVWLRQVDRADQEIRPWQPHPCSLQQFHAGHDDAGKVLLAIM